MNKYQWRMKSLAKGIDPELAIAEIERIENVYGGLTPENLLNAAMPEDSLFHSLFQWDDQSAANQYRLQQARNIINNIEINIVSDGEQRNIPVFEIVNSSEGRVYKSVENMDSNDIEYVKKSVMRDMSYLRNKLASYKEFEKTMKHLDRAIDEIEKI